MPPAGARGTTSLASGVSSVPNFTCGIARSSSSATTHEPQSPWPAGPARRADYNRQPLMPPLVPPRPRLRLLRPEQWQHMRSSLAALRKRDQPIMNGAVAVVRSVASGRRASSDSEEADGEDTTVDFSNASLYLSGIQSVFAICCCACVSVLSCWVVPEGGVSAVRTLAFCVATGAALMRTPLRVGRAHGVRVVFAALQPAVPIYLTALVVEQLVHTCTSDTSHAPSWRRVVFHGMMLMMLVSGIMRARAPLQDTDMPFLLTALALLVIAILPPPAVALVGPLCQSVTLWEAADRLVRSFAFGVVYCAHVYASTASTSLTSSETLIVVTRSASASLWTVGAHVTWLPVAVVQCGIVIMARISIEGATGAGAYRAVPDTPAAEEEDVELGGGVAEPQAQSPTDAGAYAEASPTTFLGYPQAVMVEPTIDPLEQQRELLAQPPGGLQLSFPLSGCYDAPLGGASGVVAAGVVETAEPAVPEQHAVPACCGTLASCVHAGDSQFGPRAFREVSAPPSEASASAEVPTASAAVGRAASRPPPMTAERMAAIADAIPD